MVTTVLFSLFQKDTNLIRMIDERILNKGKLLKTCDKLYRMLKICLDCDEFDFSEDESNMVSYISNVMRANFYKNRKAYFIVCLPLILLIKSLNIIFDYVVTHALKGF